MADGVPNARLDGMKRAKTAQPHKRPRKAASDAALADGGRPVHGRSGGGASARPRAHLRPLNVGSHADAPPPSLPSSASMHGMTVQGLKRLARAHGELTGGTKVRAARVNGQRAGARVPLRPIG